MKYLTMYKRAAKKTACDCGGYYYKGYTGGNALSLYVFEKHGGVNAACNDRAHDALCEVLSS